MPPGAGQASRENTQQARRTEPLDAEKPRRRAANQLKVSQIARQTQSVKHVKFQTRETQKSRVPKLLPALRPWQRPLRVQSR
jgi:hypothetical protein